MSNTLLAELKVMPERRKRGRPPGSVKDRRARLRDRTRTVATLNELLQRVTCADNASQFARWFDEVMRLRHPLRSWDTEQSGKWRKNFAGTVGLAAESLSHLEELFPDDRFYSASENRRHVRDIQAEYGLRRSHHGQTVSQLFEFGPGRLWQALWGSEDALLDLWDLYPEDGPQAWGRRSKIADVVAELAMKLWSNSRCEVAIEDEDLGRAVVLYRLEQAGIVGEPEDGIELYQCVRLAMAELSPTLRSLGIWDELATYVVGLEHDRVRSDSGYADLIEERYSSGRPFDVQTYVENPFLAMLDSVESEPWLARHMEGLAALSSYRLKFV